jgi:hypothetical protein
MTSVSGAAYFPWGQQKWDQATTRHHLDALGLPYTEAPLDVAAHAVVVPAGDVTPLEVNRVLRDIGPAVLILASDEGSTFDWSKLRGLGSPELVVWVMTPRPDRHTDMPAGTRFVGEGMPPDTLRLLAAHADAEHTKPVDVFLAGQNSHPRRHDCFTAARNLHGLDVRLVETAGFLRGIDRTDYLAHLASARLALCPAGSRTPDAFRVYEALAAGCVPLVDAVTSDPDYPDGYWDLVFPGHPFEVVQDWSQLPKHVDAVMGCWEDRAARCGAWWLQRLRTEREWLRNDLEAVTE